MSSAATVAFWIGTAATAVMTVLYGYFAFWPRKDGGHKIAFWMLLPSITAVISQSSLIQDLGDTLRSDGVEFNYERWIFYSLSLFATSSVLASYTWFDFIDGWWLNTFGLLSGVAIALAGVATGNRSWIFTAFALAFIIVWIVWLFWKPGFYGADKSLRTRGSKFAALFLAITYTLTMLLAIATFMFSNALLNVMSFELAVWLYMATAVLAVVLPFIAVWDYQPDIVHKMD